RQIADRRPSPADHAGDLGLGKLERLAETLVAGRLVHRAEIVTLQIFDQRQGQESRIVDLLHNRWDFRPSEWLNRTPTAFSRNELVLPVPRTDYHRLEQAGRLDGGGQFHQLGFI